MPGYYPNKLKSHESVIRAWMDTIVRDGGIDRYDDLHVDQIDRDWKEPTFRISAALESFEVAVGMRSEIAAKLSVVLAFSLQPSEKLLGVNFNNAEGLKHNLHVTPPSLYLLHPGMEFWTQQSEWIAIQNLDPFSLFGTNLAILHMASRAILRPTLPWLICCLPAQPGEHITSK